MSTTTEQKAMHTPGPWNFHRCSLGSEDNARNPIVDCSSGYVARLFCSRSTIRGLTSGPDLEEAEANATLIAAAPDLLIACQAALAALESLDLAIRGGLGRHGNQAVNALDAAIRKATVTTSTP